MVDFIRIVYDDKVDIEEYILVKENFEKVYTILEYHSGEILYPYKTSLDNMAVVINDKVVYVKNSIHMLNNVLKGNGEQNYNDFTYSQLCETIDYLGKKLIGLDTAKLTILEFGLNITTLVPAEVIIRENIIRHKKKRYSHNIKFGGKGEYLQFDFTDFYIKIYDKAKQNRLSDNILRFEIKFIRKREFNRLGIFKLSDLKNKSNLRRLFLYLLKRFDEMVIIDDFEHLDDDQKSLINNYLNQKHVGRKIRSRQTKLKKIETTERLIEQLDLLKLKARLRESLISKFVYLINN